MSDSAKLRRIHEALRVLKYHVLVASSRNPILLREVLPAVERQMLTIRRALGSLDPRAIDTSIEPIEPDSTSPEQVGLDIVERAVRVGLVADNAGVRNGQAQMCARNIAAQIAFVERLRTQTRQELDSLVFAQTRCANLVELQSMLSGSEGRILAIPHFGAYLWTLYYLARLASEGGQVLLLFDAPKQNPHNSPFVQAVARLESSDKVVVVHPDRRGLARCLTGLRHGAWLLLFPDLYRDVLDTQYVALFDRLLPVTPVAAKLALSAEVSILPVVGHLAPEGQVEVRLGETLAVSEDRPADVALQTLRLFQAYDPLCRDQVCCWAGIRDFARTTLAISQGEPLQHKLARMDAGACAAWLRGLRLTV